MVCADNALGYVYAFDVQEDALANSSYLLDQRLDSVQVPLKPRPFDEERKVRTEMKYFTCHTIRLLWLYNNDIILILDFLLICHRHSSHFVYLLHVTWNPKFLVCHCPEKAR